MGKKGKKLERIENAIPNGQAAQLNKISQAVKRYVIAGTTLLLVFSMVNSYLTMVTEEQLESTMFLNQYRLGSKTLTSEVQSYAVTGEQQYYDAYMKELNEDKNRDIAWAGLQENDITEDEWAMLEHIAELSNGLVPLEEESMELASKGNLEGATALVFGDEYEETIQTISSETDTCIESIQNRIAKKQSTLNVVMYLCLAAFVAAFVMIIKTILRTINFAKGELVEPIVKVSDQMTVLAQGRFDEELDMYPDDSEVGRMVQAITFMKENYTNMISEISDVLGMMGQGNYTVAPTQEYVGEFERIKESMEKIIGDTRKTLTTIQEAAREIDSGSEQLSQAAVDLAEGCTTQAGQVSEVASMVNAMAKSMEEKALDAQDTVRISLQSEEALVTGNEKMQELKEAISEISKCSEEIRTIIGAIEDIANQTNLLSLNAAIEAARAGEAGKGFAVVAEQVKNLAEESAKAAGETTKLIQMTVDAVDKGIMIADETAANMDLVLAGAKQSTNKMSQMAEALQQEANNMYRIDENVAKVAEVVDNNSAASQETAAVSEEQTAQVATMVQMMEQFEI